MGAEVYLVMWCHTSLQRLRMTRKCFGLRNHHRSLRRRGPRYIEPFIRSSMCDSPIFHDLDLDRTRAFVTWRTHHTPSKLLRYIHHPYYFTVWLWVFWYTTSLLLSYVLHAQLLVCQGGAWRPNIEMRSKSGGPKYERKRGRFKPSDLQGQQSTDIIGEALGGIKKSLGGRMAWDEMPLLEMHPIKHERC